MNHSALFRHAAELVWRNRWLWIAGLLATLGTLMGGLLLRGLLLPRLGAALAEGTALAMPERLADGTALFAGAGAGLLLLLGLWLAGALADGALIYGVDRLQRERPVSLSQSLSASLRCLGRFVVIDTLILLPPALLLAAAGLIGTGGLFALAFAGAQPGASQAPLKAIMGLTGALAAPILCAIVPVALAVYLLRLFAFRAVMLEGLPARAGLRRAWRLIRARLGPIIVLFLLLWGIRYVVGLPASLVNSTAAVLGLLPWLAPSASSFFPNPANTGLLVSVALLASAAMGVVNAVVYAFVSAAWTMAYRIWSDTGERATQWAMRRRD